MVSKNSLGTASQGLDLRTVMAFFAIYVLWGATFLAIRIAVLQIPPFFTAGTRFFIAGSLLYGFMRLRGHPRPTLAEWRGLFIIGLLMFVTTYGALFWAEQFVPSGITSVLEATMPIITLTIEVFIFRQQAFRWPMIAAVVLGFGGVALIMLNNGQRQFALFPCFVILGGSTAWCLGAVLTRSMPLPKSRPLAAGAEMMLGGGILLTISGLRGEMRPFPHITLSAGLAILYLITCGSLVAYTAYVWLLGRMPATRVSSHAYVNPIVAVALGYLVAGEAITLRTLLGSALVVASVFLILRKNVPQVEARRGGDFA